MAESGVMAPIVSSPEVATAMREKSVPILRKLTSRVGRNTPAFIISISAVPPAIARTSGSSGSMSAMASLKDAIALIDPDDPDVRAIAGGTALMLMMKAGVFRPTRLVSLRKIGDDFFRIAVTASGELTIGAMTPLAVIERSP